MKNKLPTGLDEKTIQEIINHYENQTEEEAIAEDESVYDDPNRTLIEVPKELVPVVQELIARYEAAVTKAESLAKSGNERRRRKVSRTQN